MKSHELRHAEIKGMTNAQLLEELRRRICSGDFYIDDLPKKFLSQYLKDTGVLRIESYEHLLRQLAKKKRGRDLLKSLTG